MINIVPIILYIRVPYILSYVKIFSIWMRKKLSFALNFRTERLSYKYKKHMKIEQIFYKNADDGVIIPKRNQAALRAFETNNIFLVIYCICLFCCYILTH